VISFKIRLSKAPRGWTYWWVKHHDYLTDIESSPIEAKGSKPPTGAYSFANVGDTSYFTYGGDGGLTGILTFTSHYLKLRDDRNYVINIDTNYVFEEGKPWQGWKPSLNPLPWLPSEGPPLPQGLFPPWPWVWF